MKNKIKYDFQVGDLVKYWNTDKWIGVVELVIKANTQPYNTKKDHYHWFNVKNYSPIEICTRDELEEIK